MEILGPSPLQNGSHVVALYKEKPQTQDLLHKNGKGKKPFKRKYSCWIASTSMGLDKWMNAGK
jgi:hypothetical protein